MASDENIRKMVHAIMDKRRELGIIDWGTVPPEDVIERLNKLPEKRDPNPETGSESSNNPNKP